MGAWLERGEAWWVVRPWTLNQRLSPNSVGDGELLKALNRELT